MALIIFSLLQKLKCLKIRNKCIKQPPEEVLGFFFTCLQGFPLQNSIWPEIICIKRGTYMPSVEYFDYIKESYDRKPLWLFDKLGLNWDPFCENCLRQRLSWARRLRFEPVAQPETGLSLRPFMKSIPGILKKKYLSFRYSNFGIHQVEVKHCWCKQISLQ